MHQQTGALYAPITPQQFKDIVEGVKMIYSCGGNTFALLRQLQPCFVRTSTANQPAMQTNVENPYGKTILDNVKEGKVVYIGQSAGTCCLDYAMGKATVDATVFPAFWGGNMQV